MIKRKHFIVYSLCCAVMPPHIVLWCFNNTCIMHHVTYTHIYAATTLRRWVAGIDAIKNRKCFQHFSCSCNPPIGTLILSSYYMRMKENFPNHSTSLRHCVCGNYTTSKKKTKNGFNSYLYFPIFCIYRFHPIYMESLRSFPFQDPPSPKNLWILDELFFLIRRIYKRICCSE